MPRSRQQFSSLSSLSSRVVFEKKKCSIINLYHFPAAVETKDRRRLCIFSIRSNSNSRAASSTLTIIDEASCKELLNFHSPSAEFQFPFTCVCVVQQFDSKNTLVAGMENGSVVGLSIDGDSTDEMTKTNKTKNKKAPNTNAAAAKIWELHCDGVSRCTALSINSSRSLLACGVQFENSTTMKEKDVGESSSSDDDSSSGEEDDDESGAGGGILFYDLRSNPPSLLGAYRESHSDAVNCLHFDPTVADRLYTGGNDGLAVVFDLKQSNEDDALQFTFNCVSSISRIGTWRRLEDANLYAITEEGGFYSWSIKDDDDDAADVFSFEKIDDLLFPQQRLSLNESRTRRVDEGEQLFLVDCFQTSTKSLLVVATNSDGRLTIGRVSPDNDLQKGNANNRKKACEILIDARNIGHEDMIRCIWWNDDRKLLYTAGDDGKIVCTDMSSLILEEGQLLEQEDEPAIKKMRKNK